MDTENTSPLKRTWQEIANELSEETDQIRVIELAKELNEAMLEEERRKTREKLGR